MEPFSDLVFDGSHFFNSGFLEGQIHKELADELLVAARKQTYIVSDGKYGTEPDALVAPVTTNWKSPFLPKRFTDDTPDIFTKLGQDIADSKPMAWFRESFGPFSQISMMVNKYSHRNGMVWHNDNFDGTFLSVLIYLTGDHYETIYEGGYLELGGYLDIEDDNKVRSTVVEGVRQVLPNHGQVVVINNMNPFHIHRVDPMRTEKERYTILCHLGYFEHTCQTHKRVVGV